MKLDFISALEQIYQNRKSDEEFTDPLLLYCKLSGMCTSSNEDKLQVLWLYQVNQKINVVQTVLNGDESVYSQYEQVKDLLSEDSFKGLIHALKCAVDPEYKLAHPRPLTQSKFVDEEEEAEDEEEEEELTVAEDLAIPAPTPAPALYAAAEPKRIFGMELNGATIAKLSVGGGLLFSLLLLIIFAGVFHWPWSGWQWIVGIYGGIILSGGIVWLVIYLSDEGIFELYESGTVAVGICLAVNIILQLILMENYRTISGCLSVFELAGAGVLAWKTYDDSEEVWGLGQIIEAVIAGLILILSILSAACNWPWIAWQWIIGIVGGLIITAVAVWLIYLLDDNYYVSNCFIASNVILGVSIVVNVILQLALWDNYKIIFCCLSVFELVCGVIIAMFAFARENKIMGVIGAVEAAVALIAMIVFVCFFGWTWATWQWMVGIFGGIVLIGGICALLTFLDDEGVLDFYIAGAIAMAVLLIANAVLQAIFRENYVIIFGCLSVYEIVCGIAFAVLSFKEDDILFGVIGIIEAVVSLAIFITFLCITAWTWTTWQWIIGIFGGIVLIGGICALLTFLDEEGVLDFYITAPIALAAIIIVNIILHSVFTYNYRIIFGCLSVCAIISSIALAIYSFMDDETQEGIVDVAESVVAAGLFIVGMILI